MYNNENTIWFSQTLLTYKDRQFATDGYLKISISTNTSDYKFYNPPLFNISISTNLQKSYNLNIQHAEDLLESFNQALKQANGNETIIEKKYQKTANIYFKFALDNVNKIRVVVIEIISNEADSTKIIIPLKPTFQSFLRRLKSFVENYDKVCYRLLNKTIDGETTQIVKQLPTLIKGVSSQIISNIPEENFVEDSCAPEITSEDVEKTSMTIADLDNFMGDNMENIDLPELKEEKVDDKPKFVEVKSKFVEDVLKNDLANLESKLISFAVSKQPVLDLADDLEKSLKFKLLDGVNETDKKSLVYLSTLVQNYFAKSNTINNKPIPSSTLLLKLSVIKDDNKVEFAKDILTIIGFMRMVRHRLESKISNAFDNKSMVYLYLRSFMDPFCFSYIDHLNKNEVVSAVKNRYLYFDQNGLFNSYKIILEENGCEPIVLQDLMEFAEKAFEEFKTPFIDKVHENFYNKDEVKLPTKNQFSLEQITNEFIPVEVSYKLGFDFTNKEAVQNYKEKNNVSDEILKFFTSKKKVTPTIKMEKVTPLQRWVDKYKQDIPDEHRESFIEFVKKLQYEKFNFEENTYPLDEFDENIIKALYVWDVETDPDMKSNFTHFASLIENEQMTKDSILITVSDNDKTSEWDNMNL
ncbi:MAG: hypothetical protein ACFFG0_01325 [Candidatus Thorarchaeota archaeon]